MFDNEEENKSSPKSLSLSEDKLEEVDLRSSATNSKINGDGEVYSKEQLAELREYLSMLADLAIDIYNEQQKPHN